MTAEVFRTARLRKGWTQARAARELGVSQGYVALLESGARQASEELRRLMVKKLDMSPTAILPTAGPPIEADRLAVDLANLGYPGFAHLVRRQRAIRNPAAVLFDALQADNLDARMVEALPWLVARFPDLDWDWLVPRVKVLDLQNRLGFVVALARQLAERSMSAAVGHLRDRESSLERSRLAREDAFGRSSITETEIRWLRANRSEPAAHWNVLSNLTAEHLRHME
jgi:transcriptional regulator with XRE-family HTH domain